MTNEEMKILVNKYGDMILRIAYTYLRSKADAEDTVQDVFIKIIEKKPIFDNESHEKAWIVRITINECKDKIKSFWNKNINSIDDFCQIQYIDKYNENSDVMDAVLSLPDKYKIVVHLYYYEEYSTAEISHILGKTVTLRRGKLLLMVRRTPIRTI